MSIIMRNAPNAIRASLIGLALLTIGCGESSNPTAPSATLLTINIAGDRGSQSYSPNPLTMHVGQMVNWKNNDSVEHTATLEGVFDTGNIPPMSAKNTPLLMNTPGTFTYHCTQHPDMVGTIVVTQ